MPKLVYLDSSDFSDLSAPEAELTEQDRRVVQILRLNHDNQNAAFLLSPIHFSEAVHATEDPRHKTAAVRRATLMEGLCDRNFLRMPHQIVAVEIARAVKGADDTTLETKNLFSSEAEWFGLPISPGLQGRRQAAMEKLNQRNAHMPRHERRKLAAEWSFSKAEGRRRWRELFSATPELTNEFPFNLLKKEIFIDWLVGDISEPELIGHLAAIFNRPTEMMKSILDATEERYTIYSMLRSEGQRLTAAMELRLQPLYELLIQNPAHVDEFSKVFHKAIQKIEIYREVISGFGNVPLSSLDDRAVKKITKACPALNSLVESYLAYGVSKFESLAQRVRHGRLTASQVPGKVSDFGDLMHAVYAPYCDFFRCDSSFGSLLKRNPKIRGKIADKRDHLLSLGQSA